MIDIAKNWLKSRAEIASRQVRIPTESEIIMSTSWISDPDSAISRAFLPNIIKHASQEQNAQGITRLIIDSYNRAVETSLGLIDGAILCACLDLYASAITPDKEVARMVVSNIAQAKAASS